MYLSRRRYTIMEMNDLISAEMNLYNIDIVSLLNMARDLEKYIASNNFVITRRGDFKAKDILNKVLKIIADLSEVRKAFEEVRMEEMYASFNVKPGKDKYAKPTQNDLDYY
jgi:hypothetical protein